MNKIFALYSNEMTKISRKISVWLCLSLMLVSSIIIPVLIKYLGDNEYTSNYILEGVEKADFTQTRDSIQQQLGDSGKYIQHATLHFTISGEVKEVFATYLNLDDDQVYQYAQMTTANELLTNYDFEKYPIGDTFLSQSSYLQYERAWEDLCYLNSVPFEDRDDFWYRDYINRTEVFDASKKALYEHNYKSLCDAVDLMAGYSNFGSQFLDSTYSYSSTSIKELSTFDPEGKLSVAETYRYLSTITYREDYKEALEQGIENTNYYEGNYQLLSQTRRKELEDKIQIINYQMEENKLPDDSVIIANTGLVSSLTIAKFFLSLMLAIIAGSCISSELATGSIKSLIIAPVKRWKIFVAKILSILTLLFLGSFIITATSTILTQLLFGNEILLPYFYVANGSVKKMPYFIFTFIYFFVDNISMIFYVFLAFTISCMSKNTAVAVGTSISLVMGGGIIGGVLSLFKRQRWIDFLPTSNMNLISGIFPHIDRMGFMTSDEAGIFLGVTTSSNNSSKIKLKSIFNVVLKVWAYKILFSVLSLRNKKCQS